MENQKTITINKIKAIIINNDENFCPIQVGEDAIVKNLVGKDHYETIESYNFNSVTVCEYVHEMEINSYELEYEKLSQANLKEILGQLVSNQ